MPADSRSLFRLSTPERIATRSDGEAIAETQLVFRERHWPAGILTRDRWIGRRLKWHIEWKREDLWIGAFWRTYRFDAYGDLWPYASEAWVCVLPCLPINVVRYQHDARPRDWSAGWWRSKPWRWDYRALYRAHREEGNGRVLSIWRSATFPHVHEDDA